MAERLFALSAVAAGAVAVAGYGSYLYTKAKETLIIPLPVEEPTLLLTEVEELLEAAPEPEVVEVPEEVVEEEEVEVEVEKVVIDWGSVPAIDRVNLHIRRFEMAVEQNQDESLAEELSRNLRYWKAVKTAIEIGQG